MRLRGLLACGLLAPLIGGLGGCAVNPATGRLDYMLVSHEEEEQIGRETHRQVLIEFGGVYYDSALASYVEKVGARLTAVIGDSGFNYSFTILDSPSINAFALSGGYVYVTRGLLALVSNEAELANVLSHELAHINARHGAQRLSRIRTRERLCEIFPCAGNTPILRSLVAIGATLAFEGFTQEQELEADEIGLRYLATAGYRQDAMVSFLEKLKAHEALEAKTVSLGDEPLSVRRYESTHPLPETRIAHARMLTGKQRPAGADIGETAYLNAIDGMLYGNRPEYGFVVGSQFVHPIRRIALTVPEGYPLRADSRRVSAYGPDGAIILFEPSRVVFTGPVEDYLTTLWAKDVPLEDVRRLTVNGMEGATGWLRRETSRGPTDFRLVALRAKTGVIYRLLFLTPAHMTARLSEDMRRATYSLRTLSEAEAAALKPQRIRIVAAAAGDTIARLSARTSLAGDATAHLSIMNGIANGADIEPGRLIKLVQ